MSRTDTGRFPELVSSETPGDAREKLRAKLLLTQHYEPPDTLLTGKQPDISLDAAVENRRRPAASGVESRTSGPSAIDDYELGPLLRQVDEISGALKSGGVDIETVGQALRDAVSCAVKQFLVQRELRTLAFTDELTGLYNRRGFRAAATQQLKLAYRESRNCLFFLADVDRLKQVNDSYGHREGDLTLIRVADALNLTFRDSDIMARLGGDEFVALASNTSPYDEDIILRRLRKNLRELTSRGSPHDTSLTVGVAHFDPLHPVLLEDLVVQADGEMYKRKRR